MHQGLELSAISVTRGALPVCREVTLHAALGELTVLLGANGAGKTTLLEAVAGVLPAAAGTVRLAGHDITRWTPQRRAAAGLGYVQQGRKIFTGLTARQHIAVVDRAPAAWQRACELFPALTDRRDIDARLLSGGEQQMLVIARALAANPSLLMIDELSLGLSPQVTHELLRVLSELARDGMGVLVVEQFAELALASGGTGYELERGTIRGMPDRSAP